MILKEKAEEVAEGVSVLMSGTNVKGGVDDLGGGEVVDCMGEGVM